MTKVVNVKKERSDVYIGRMKNTDEHFGNPFMIGRDGDRSLVISKFRQWLEGNNYFSVEPARRKWILANLHVLKDKKLGCFCKPDACHGDVYVELLDG
jgi:hypothetical protein